MHHTHAVTSAYKFHEHSLFLVICFCWLSLLQLGSSLLSFALTFSPRTDSTRKGFEILCWAPPPVCPPSMYLM